MRPSSRPVESGEVHYPELGEGETEPRTDADGVVKKTHTALVLE